MKIIQYSLICIGLLCGIPSSGLAHPGGTTISMGSNPVRSFSGFINLSTTTMAESVFTVPETQEFIITDVVAGLTATNFYCMANGRLILKDETGVELAQFPLYFSHQEQGGPPNTTALQAVSGIRVAAGTVISVQWGWSYKECSSSYYAVPFTVTGYLTQP